MAAEPRYCDYVTPMRKSAEPYLHAAMRLLVPDGGYGAGTIAMVGALYLRWCRTVGFDNARKYTHLRTGSNAQLPGFEPEDFFASWLQDHVSGTCWAAAEALHALLVHLGIATERICGRIERGEGSPDHAAIIAHIDGTPFLLDPAILSNSPLPLVEDVCSSISAWGVSCSFNGIDTISWLPPHTGADCRFRITDRNCSRDTFRTHYQKTRDRSLFNATPFFRRNLAHGTVTITQGFMIRTDLNGTLTYNEQTREQEKTAVRELCGVSESMLESVFALQRT